MIVGLIPARGGSKGIPRKNLMKVGDESLLQRGIRLLNDSGCDQVWVTSDDQEILHSASLAGSSCVTRPQELASDTASTEAVILHFINELGLLPNDLIVVHQITSPFLLAASVKRCIEKLEGSPNLNSVLVGSIEHSFEWQINTLEQWEPKGHSREYRPRRQELPLVIRESGGVYVARVGAVLKSSSRFPAPTFCLPITFLESLDIDTPEDLEIARTIEKGIKHANT